MGNSVLSIGVTGLNAAQMGLVTTGHNIANAATPGFSRQQIVQSTNIAQLTGSGYLGQGTSVDTVRRVYNQFLASQVMGAETTAAQLDAYSGEIQQIDNLLADPSAGLSPALQAFFRGVADVAANPASIPSRQSMLSAATALTTRLQSLDSRLAEVREGVNSQLTSAIGEINSIAGRIASLNNRIVLAQSAGQNTPPNDLLDQRDRLLGELNKLVRTATSVQDDGSINVFVGNGQPMVVGAQSYQLAAVQDPFDPTRITVGYVTTTGTVRLQESLLSGGTLGGLLAFRNETLDPAQNALGRVALGLAATFNAQHQLGQDLTGALGGDFFRTPAPLVLASSQNSGTASVGATVTDVGRLTTSDYLLSYDGANYTLRRLSDNTSWSGVSVAALNTAIAGEGFSVSLTAGIAAGDAFKILPTRAGARDIGVAVADVRSIAAAAPIRTAAPLSNTGTATVSAGTVDGPPPANANLQHTVTLTFTGAGTFDVVDNTAGTTLASGVAYSSGADISYNGWTIQITGVPAAGDQFTVGANSGGVADNRNALLLGQLQTRNLLAGGSASYQSAYSQLVSAVGNKAREIQVTLTAQQNLVKQASDAQQAMSGVNLDEEAANLIRYQQAYQASAKVIAIASKLFDTLLELG
jgi:flagellar hook-associated protein 1 FlgK